MVKIRGVGVFSTTSRFGEARDVGPWAGIISDQGGILPQKPAGCGGFLEEKSLGNFQQKEWNHGGFQWDFRFKRWSNVVFQVEKLCFFSYGFNGSWMLVQDDFMWFQESNECSKGIFSLGIYKKPSKLGIEWVSPHRDYPIWWVGVFCC